jgi:oryzin
VSHTTSGSTSYVYDSSTGAGTYAYIVDTGLLTTHEEFGDRASYGYNAVGGANVDSVGHGEFRDFVELPTFQPPCE